MTAPGEDVSIARIDAKLEGMTVRLQEMEKRMDQRFDQEMEYSRGAAAAAAAAAAKSDRALEERFKSVNEFRTALSDATAKNLTRVEYDRAHQALVEKVDHGLSSLATNSASERNTIVAKLDSEVEKLEAEIKGAQEYVAEQRGAAQKALDSRTLFLTLVMVLVGVTSVVSSIAIHFLGP